MAYIIPEQRYLEECMITVMNQTYSNWELCIADGGNTMEKTLAGIVKNDSRVKYVALTENLGISGNTNAALELATGDYIVLGDTLKYRTTTDKPVHLDADLYRNAILDSVNNRSVEDLRRIYDINSIRIALGQEKAR